MSKRAKKAAGPQNLVYSVELQEGDPYRRTETTKIGLYSSKEAAVRNAKSAMDDSDIGTMWRTDADSFEVAKDNSDNCPDDGKLLEFTDLEGSFTHVIIRQFVIDGEYVTKGERQRKKSGASASGSRGSHTHSRLARRGGTRGLGTRPASKKSSSPRGAL